MATTIADICNLALDTLGATPIVSIDDANVRAEACKRNYELALRDILEAHPWNFAKARASLVAATAPIFEWTNAWTLPTDFVRLLQLNGVNFLGEAGAFYEIEGLLLLTDETVADVQYVSLPADPTKFPGKFTTAFAFLLASRIAPALRQDGVGASMNLLQLYQQALGRAKVIDSNQQRSERYDPATESRFVASRYWRNP